MASPIDTELGFVEKVDCWRLNSKFFPSKVGGKPSWLRLKNLPAENLLQCHNCKKQCVFLLQVYAPVTEKESCFHRTVFIFCCRNPQCYSSSNSPPIVVFRCQLPRINEFYDFEPPEEKENGGLLSPDDFGQKLCVVCGCAGPKQCGKCHKVTYCSRDHQTVDWRDGHKINCGNQGCEMNVSKLLFPEYEIVTEAEEYEEPEENEKCEADKMKEYAEFMESEEAKSVMKDRGLTDHDLERMALHENDEQFTVFQKRINHEPEQVLRYNRGGKPLWVSSENIPKDEEIPACQCGAKRKFEFQIMPQLLIHLNVDSIGESLDWGTLGIYTCSDSCDGISYHQEYVWKQDYSNGNK
ncbi:programmed cell death protein 2-like [Saccoglossus kowalevskii]|uniref:Programmed cell death protein 2-like n=1 Tax=Saccoglossus kowalevskii TaxID=10224 RepID=A0ABM0GL72_SACKO|nr:PREDICTED: programmed cell death protein 2-like [Saccoglossus kowalevskii]